MPGTGEKTITFNFKNQMGEKLTRTYPLRDATKNVRWTLMPMDFKDAQPHCFWNCGLTSGALREKSKFGADVVTVFVRKATAYVVMHIRGVATAIRFHLNKRGQYLVAEFDGPKKVIPKIAESVLFRAPTGKQRIGKAGLRERPVTRDEYKPRKSTMRGRVLNPVTMTVEKIFGV